MRSVIKLKESYYARNRERLLQDSKDYYFKNKDKVQEYYKGYYEKNKTKIHERQKMTRPRKEKLPKGIVCKVKVRGMVDFRDVKIEEDIGGMRMDI